jgi:hypothetical protein
MASTEGKLTELRKIYMASLEHAGSGSRHGPHSTGASVGGSTCNSMLYHTMQLEGPYTCSDFGSQQLKTVSTTAYSDQSRLEFQPRRGPRAGMRRVPVGLDARHAAAGALHQDTRAALTRAWESIYHSDYVRGGAGAALYKSLPC